MPIIAGSPRDKEYIAVASCVGKTPLYEIRNIEIPNGCRIFCKEEYLNPTGSHYDRFWVPYLRHLENTNRISIEHTLIETSTGNSGASFAWACRALGFQDYRVVIPEDMPYTRISQIQELGAKIELSEAGRYVEGLIEKFASYVDDVRSKSQRPVSIPNHSRYGTVSLNSLAMIVDEVMADLPKGYRSVSRLDYFVTALGNGLSTKGMGERLKNRFPAIKLIGIEAAQSPTIYTERTKTTPPPTTGKTHGLLGTSPGMNSTVFPIMHEYATNLTDVNLIEETDWNEAGIKLANFEGKFVGHTSAASFHQAMQIAKKVSNKNILIVFYDPAWKYMKK